MPAGRTNKTRHLILGLLSEGPLSGYEIRRLTHARFRFFWSESFGQLYPELARLEREGLAVREDAPRRGRHRNEYRITPAGSRTLHDWLGEPVVPEAVRQEILLKVYFSALVDRSVL
ncbi:MAG TPA: PadR family transcriptional regulator, partial [Anaeromyxobacteraceae bacterium]